MTAPGEATPLDFYAAVQRSADAQLKRVLRVAASQANARILRAGSGIGGQIRSAQLASVMRDIKTQQTKLWGNVEANVLQWSPKAIAAADDAAKHLMGNVLESRYSPKTADKLVSSFITPNRGLALDQIREKGYKHQLAESVYKNKVISSGTIETRIRAGIVQNLSAREMAKEVKDLIDPNVKGGVANAAMRLARTEINNAFHEEQTAIAEESELVQATKWNLSGRHPVPDKCNDYAKGGDKNDGVFAPGKLPKKPHPQCLCYMTYVLPDEDDILALIDKLSREE